MICKVFQKLIYDKMHSYSNGIILLQFQCIFQTGFWPQSCLVQMFGNWKVNLDLGGRCGIPSIDLLKVRDCTMYHLCVVVAIVVLFHNMTKKYKLTFHKPLKYNRNTICKLSQDSGKPAINDRSTSSGN